jgi:hypothetical protein
MVEKEDVTQVGSDFGFRPSFGLRISDFPYPCVSSPSSVTLRWRG